MTLQPFFQLRQRVERPHCQWLIVPLISVGLSAFLDIPIGTAQTIAPAVDRTGTTVILHGDRYDISGGQRSQDGANLFHSFERFGLNSGEIANFLSTPAIQNILGRVIGGNPSYINGLIQVIGGNSNLFLLNPAGIVFGANASLNVPASFTATTANGIGFGSNWFHEIGSNDYANLIGNPNTFAFTTPQPGSIANFGNLAVPTGQNLTLLGGTVLNLGRLSAPGGQITVAAVPGETLVRLSQAGTMLNLEFSPWTATNTSNFPNSLPISPLTLPQLLTGGNLGNATGAIAQPDGTILLTGSNTRISATTGTAIVSGRLATTSSIGGNVTILGNQIALSSAVLDASGTNGGGRIHIGGDYQGQGLIPNADQTFISHDSVLRADATTTGNGGQVIVWSEQATRFDGTITARGGAISGNGGFVETSAKGNLTVLGHVDASASNGLAGSWLLDPNNITIQAAGVDTNVTGNPIFTSTADDAIVTTASIQAALNLGTDVTITTATGGTQLGNITVANNIDKTAGGDATLTLNAINDITVNAAIASTSGKLNLNLNADSDSSGDGLVSIFGNISTLGGNITAKGATTSTDVAVRGVQTIGLINSSGGDITLSGTSNTGAGVITFNPISSGGGKITFNGTSRENAGAIIQGDITSNSGEILVDGTTAGSAGIITFSTINSGDGNITLNGISTGTDALARGIQVQGNILSGSGDIVLTGNSKTNDGVVTFSSITSNSGNITLNGTSAGTDDSARGIAVQGNILSSSGDIVLTGNSKTSDGVVTFSPITSNSGNITLNGTSTGTDDFARGIAVQGNILSGSGDIVLTGNSENNIGVLTLRPITSNSGNITLNGTSMGTGKFARAKGIDIEASVTSGGSNITLNADKITIGSTGALNPGGGAIALAVSDSLTLSNPINTTGSFSLTSTTALTLSQAVNTNGGAITLQGTSIDTSATTLNSGSTTGNGGAISLTATQGDLVTGDLNSSGIKGGDITLISPTAITTGTINSSGISGDGGNVTIDPIGDVQVTAINAQGGTSGTGGTVDITAGQFFRAVGSFTDQNGINASISTAGGQGGGDITIRHGGGLLGTAFEIGNATTNGTAGAITTGNSNRIEPTQSFLGPYIQGNIQILTPFNSSAVAVLQQPDPATSLSVATTIPLVSLDQLFTLMEESLTHEFATYLELSSTPPIRTLADAQNALQSIEEKTGIRSALLYVSFRDANDLERSPTSSNANSSANNVLELLLVTGNGKPIYKRISEATQVAVLKVAQTFRNEVADPSKTLTQSYLPSAEQLYRWIIAPIKPELQAQGIQNLALILDNGLRFIPIAALHDGQSFLMEQYSLGLMPTFSLTDTRYGSAQDEPLLAAGASLFPDSENPLPAVPIELEAITQGNRSLGRMLLNQTFTLQNLNRQRQQTLPGIVHLATHGKFLPGDIRQSYIRFWDISLGLDQLKQLGWNQPTLELASLSACQMALGDAKTELGFAGLAVKTGAKSALASLWNISDEGTAGLMAEFYQQLRRSLIKAGALQQAQIALLQEKVHLQQGKLVWSGGALPLPKELTENGNRNFSHPYYWAAFTMIGSPW
ncbi:CHAT domain-containing protein [Pantanalinema sp. GBBB05]|uniref:CHAT domain-containing protein n=1 Tax=Pantanalinema sp. GBBB05 TaxID=2604139 RepID=UPI003D81B9CB